MACYSKMKLSPQLLLWALGVIAVGLSLAAPVWAADVNVNIQAEAHGSTNAEANGEANGDGETASRGEVSGGARTEANAEAGAVNSNASADTSASGSSSVSAQQQSGTSSDDDSGTSGGNESGSEAIGSLRGTGSLIGSASSGVEQARDTAGSQVTSSAGMMVDAAANGTAAIAESADSTSLPESDGEVAAEAVAGASGGARALIESGTDNGDNVPQPSAPDADLEGTTEVVSPVGAAASLDQADEVNAAIQSALEGEVASSVNAAIEDDVHNSVQEDLVDDLTNALPINQ
ncbi:MAG: hypothetical protein U5K76_03160 [Woeseiaceae bacterium]|nr:hypothetical protein [Woeseiaceae bacterium]